MTAVRHLLAQRQLAALLCAVTLLLKLFVPSGYMIGSEHGRTTIELCSGVASQPMAMAMAMPEMHDDTSDHGKKDHGKPEMPCAFSGLSVAALGSIDPIQLATLIAFIGTIGLCPIVPTAVVRQIHLRPPLRGPPVTL